MNKITEHFDKIAKDYDYYKSKSWYYYENLKKLYRGLIPPEKALLDIGCATGDILISLKPRYGLGIDISPEMIKIAQYKHKEKQNIEFRAGKIWIRASHFIYCPAYLPRLEHRKHILFEFPFLFG